MALDLAKGADEGARSLEGRLVQIGTVDRIEPDAAVRDRFPDVGPVDVSGERGRVTGWEQGQYVVHTFSGHVVLIPEDKLTEFEPAEAEEPGGFDVAWPSLARASHESSVAEGLETFTAQVASKIVDQGFCVVQLFEGDEAAMELVDQCGRELDWGTIREDVEEEYLGEEPQEGKVSWIRYVATPSQGMRTYELEDMGANMNMSDMGAFERADKYLTNVPALLSRYTPLFEGEQAFFSWGRTNALVRANYDLGDDKKKIKRNSLGADDADELDAHLAFVDSRKLCIMYMVHNEGGELILTPAAEAYDYNQINIPLSKNKLVIFRCDDLGFTYSYRPEGQNLCFQSWALEVPSAIREREETLRFIDGPDEPEGRRNNVMSVMTRYPGNSYEPLAYWSMLSSGSDTQVCVPQSRWDVDIYYRKEHTIGFSMTCHGAMLQTSEITSFDNKFFGISSEESETIAPYMRVLLEVGYETLHRAGHRREELNGWNCGVFVGDSGSDWDSFTDFHATPSTIAYRYAGRERSAACTRLSHIFGLTGPVSTAETACSSSLVACGIAQMTMRKREGEQKSASISTDLYHGLVLGSNTLIGVGSYISLSGPGMLTTHGRCFTFDQSADGFARGEGIGGIKLKVCRDSIDAMDRIAMLIGCCVNQDGRSASMTAPHGPSQQAVIRESMREAGLSPKSITIAECHGTGTALGDPIEVGALRGVLGSGRTAPILKTSAKTNIGHLEAGAGVAGLIKCICMLNYSTGAPNCHLLTLNPHLDVAGFPVYFQTEAMDYGQNSGLTGVSSFGFGGTNARADVWGHATQGPRYCVSGQTVKPIPISY